LSIENRFLQIILPGEPRFSLQATLSLPGTPQGRVQKCRCDSRPGPSEIFSHGLDWPQTGVALLKRR